MIAKVWSLPLGAHVVALLLVVAVGIGLTGPGVAFFSDEGAVVVQTQLLARDHTWLYDPTTSAIDPEGAARPFENGDLGTRGLAPYAKHPLYPAALAVVSRGSAVAAVAVSVLALVAAATLAALLAGRMAPASPGFARATLWVVGLASPLWFASGLVVAHTLAAAVAALAAWATVCLVLPRGEHGRVATVALLALVGGACLAAAALRTEAVFLGPALAVAVLAGGVAARRGLAVAVAVSAVGGSVLARLLDRSWSSDLVGDALPAPTDNPVPTTGSWVLDRLHGLYTTVLQAGYSLTRGQELALWSALVVLAGGALAWRLRWVSTRVALLLGAVGAALYTVRFVVGPDGAVPGLLVAFPLLAVALVLLDRRVLEQRVAALLLVASVLCLAAIVLTQYPNGGGLEWGWRYSTFVLPMLLPPVLWGAWLCVRDRVDARALLGPAVALVLVVAIVPSFVGLRAMASSHDADRRLAASIAAVAGEASDDGHPPVVLSWNRLLPQILYQDFDDYEWVVPARAELATYADRLAEAGVDRVILVGPDGTGAIEELSARGWEPVDTGPDAPYDVVVLGRS